MKNKVDVQSDIMFEHRFWLQILGDHARFIHQSLAPKRPVRLSKQATLSSPLTSCLNAHAKIFLARTFIC